MTTDLAGKVALVTGASSGIGRAAALRFAEEGMSLALVARSDDKLHAIAGGLPGEHLVLPADLTKGEAVDELVPAVLSRFGRIDVVFANAGIYVPGLVADGDPAAWDQMITLNVASVFRLVQRALTPMLARGQGDIVVTSSISGHQAIHWEPIYSATKHAVQSFVHGLRRQVAPQGLRVGSLAPGMVLNELWGIHDQAEIDRKGAERTGLRSEDVVDALVFMLTRPANVTIRDLVILPQNQDL